MGVMNYKFLILIMLSAVLLLSGCSTTKEIQFTDIVKDEVSKISMRNSISGILFTTTNADLINKFVSAMKSDNYDEISSKDITGNSTIHLYNKYNEEIANIVFEGKHVIRINNKSYSIKANIEETYLESFYKELFVGKNITLVGEEEKAYEVVQEYFNAFAKADYGKMSTLATDSHNKNLVHDGDVWGMKWAKAKEIKFAGNYPSKNEKVDSALSFGVSVDMETVKTSAQYPSTQTFFFIILIKDEDGNWRVDRYTTG